LQTCTLYGQPHNTRLDDERIFELGLGIHGEPGVEQRSLQPIRLIVEQMVGMLVGALVAGNEGWVHARAEGCVAHGASHA
jgi:dihydroxyacetone kinase